MSSRYPGVVRTVDEHVRVDAEPHGTQEPMELGAKIAKGWLRSRVARTRLIHDGVRPTPGKPVNDVRTRRYQVAVSVGITVARRHKCRRRLPHYCDLWLLKSAARGSGRALRCHSRGAGRDCPATAGEPPRAGSPQGAG